jgi:hypothetical protein
LDWEGRRGEGIRDEEWDGRRREQEIEEYSIRYKNNNISII